MIWQEVALAILGLAGLTFGAEWLVIGSSRFALSLGVSPLIVGLTIVAFGTSSPELGVCLNANARGDGDLVMGNIVGSNICNIALILGVAAMIRPLRVREQIVLREMPILLVATALLLVFIQDRRIVAWEAGLLVACLLLFLWLSARTSAAEIKRSALEEAHLPEAVPRRLSRAATWRNVCLIVIGMAALLIGADLLVGSAEFLAARFGVPAAVIGLSVVAIGTSLPELATSISASVRREGDLITGNVVGSNIFNTLAILGITGCVSSIVYQDLRRADLWFMTALTVILLPMLWTKRSLTRWQAGLLLIAYGVYCFFLYVRIQSNQLAG